MSEDFTRSKPIEPLKSYQDYSEYFLNRQKTFKETENNFGFVFYGSTLINLMSDLHVGHATTDYKRIEDETNEIVATANSYVLLAGDLIDNLWWNPGQMEQMEQTPEQVGFIRSWINHLADNGKLLHAISGDHEDWLKRAGISLNEDLLNRGVSVSRGPTYFDVEVENQSYTMAGAHALPGHSIYNNTHPQMRAVRFGSMHGAEIVFSGHNHKKGVATSYQHDMGEPLETHYIALGPYKATDEYLQKKGFPMQEPEEMFGISVLLDGATHTINVSLDIVEANRRHHESS